MYTDYHAILNIYSIHRQIYGLYFTTPVHYRVKSISSQKNFQKVLCSIRISINISFGFRKLYLEAVLDYEDYHCQDEMTQVIMFILH